MNDQMRAITALGLVAALCGSCSLRSGDLPESGGELSGATVSLEQVSNGFGQLVPHTLFRLDSNGLPTAEVVSIRTQRDLVENLRADNPLRPVPGWPAGAELPGGAAGNHFLRVTLEASLDIDTVLDPSPDLRDTGGLADALSVLSIDPVTGDTVAVRGRAFVDGWTYAGTPSGNPPALELQRWVELAGGRPSATRPEGVGFPGTEADFAGSAALVDARTLVFVVDTDGDLSTHETFPAGRQIVMRLSTGVQAEGGVPLESTVLGSSTVGPDVLRPELARNPPPTSTPRIVPGNGDVDVDPTTTVLVYFTEPVQPLSVGPLERLSVPGSSELLEIDFGPSANRTQMPYTVRPPSVFDMSTFEVIPAYSFPGSGPPEAACNTFSLIDVTIHPSPSPQEPYLQDLANNGGLPNGNQLGALTSFTTGEGEAVSNVPVLPDAIVVGRGGSLPGISVLDLNAFGQGTGNPTFTEGVFLQGESNFPNNPNLQLPGLVPPLQRGSCTINGGSAGVFTLSHDSSLDDLLVRPPDLASVADMMLGHALDSVFNNSATTCQLGGGDACADTSEKLVLPVLSTPATQAPVMPGQFTNVALVGEENLMSWAPHPNPPPIVYPPLCVSPFLATQEPSSVRNGELGIDNALVPGDPFGAPPDIPPGGLLTPAQNMFFQGPDFGVAPGEPCLPFAMRQQVGQFLYVVDRQAAEVVVLNSNRMSVIDRIPLPDPTSLAMGPDVDLLAVSNQREDSVSFIDIDPASATFHDVVHTAAVGSGPRGLAWDPGNEDLLVCNEDGGTVSILDASSLQVRRTIDTGLDRPFDVAMTQRHSTWGTLRNVYFAYILNRSGRLAVFESGPSGVNGWGYDDVIDDVQGILFRKPKAIQADPNNLLASVWIAHEGPIDPVDNSPGPEGVGAISNVFIESFLPGQIPLGNDQTPGLRSMQFGVGVSIGEDRLSGIPADIAFDNQRSLAALPNVFTAFSSGAPAALNGKSLVRRDPDDAGIILNAHASRFLFAAVPGPTGGSGVVDVLDVSSAGSPRVDTDVFEPGVQSVPAAGARLVIDYWRQ